MASDNFDPVPACFSGVQWLPIPRLERIVLEKLRRLEKHLGTTITLPIPVEEMIEEVERIPVEAFEGSDRFPADVLGAYDFRGKVMFVREDIEHVGRKRFTQAHEYGHFVLHSGHFLQGVFDFFGSDDEGSVQLFREQSSTRNKLEYQANKFASHFLMPTHLVKELIDPLQRSVSIDELQRMLSSQAQVSLTAAGIRLRDFGLS